MDWREELREALGLAPSARPTEEGDVEVVVRGKVIWVPRMTTAELFEQLGLSEGEYIAFDLDTATPLCLSDPLPARVGIVPVRVDG